MDPELQLICDEISELISKQRFTFRTHHNNTDQIKFTIKKIELMLDSIALTPNTMDFKATLMGFIEKLKSIIGDTEEVRSPTETFNAIFGNN